MHARCMFDGEITRRYCSTSCFQRIVCDYTISFCIEDLDEVLNDTGKYLRVEHDEVDLVGSGEPRGRRSIEASSNFIFRHGPPLQHFSSHADR